VNQFPLGVRQLVFGSLAAAPGLDRAGGACIARGSYKGVVDEYAFTERHDMKFLPVMVYGFQGGQLQPSMSF
jgi:hypothetical protein